MWTQLWNFIVRLVKFNAFLHPNEHLERIFSYLVRQFEAELAKIGHFQISKSIFEAKYDSIFLKPKFLFEYQIRRTTFIKSIYFFNHSCKNLFSKNVPYFCQLHIKLSYKILHWVLPAFLWNSTTVVTLVGGLSYSLSPDYTIKMLCFRRWKVTWCQNIINTTIMRQIRDQLK